MQPPPIRRPRDGGKNEDDEKEKSFIKIEKEIEARVSEMIIPCLLCLTPGLTVFCSF